MLARLQEDVLLKVLLLGPDCTVNNIQEKMSEEIGKEQSFGSIFTTLDRLYDKKLVEWKKGSPNEKSAGKAPRLYTITAKGRTAVSEAIEAQKAKYARINTEGILPNIS